MILLNQKIHLHKLFYRLDAKYEADRASIPLTLMDIDNLVLEILNNYENMDIETKMLLPLKKVYWPK